MVNQPAPTPLHDRYTPLIVKAQWIGYEPMARELFEIYLDNAENVLESLPDPASLDEFLGSIPALEADFHRGYPTLQAAAASLLFRKWLNTPHGWRMWSYNAMEWYNQAVADGWAPDSIVDRLPSEGRGERPYHDSPRGLD